MKLQHRLERGKTRMQAEGTFRWSRRTGFDIRLVANRTSWILASLVAAVVLAGCGGAAKQSGGGSTTVPSTPAPGLPTPAAAGASNSYLGFQTLAQWTAKVDSSKNTFAYTGVTSPQTQTQTQTQPATAILTASGSTKTVNGFLDLGMTGDSKNGYALEIPGRVLLLRPGGVTQPLVVAAAQPSGCIPTGGVAFNFVSMPELVAGQATDTAVPSYGTISASTNADGTAISFKGQQQFKPSPPGTVVSGPYPSAFSATCSVTGGAASITVPPTAAFASPIEMQMGPAGFFNEAYVYGASAGFPRPATPTDAKALTATTYLGFLSFAAVLTPVASTVMPVAFGIQPSASGSLAGGEFPDDDITQTPNAEYTLTLGTQSSLVNGLYEGAQITEPNPNNAICGTAGVDAVGNPTCTIPAIAIAGISEGKSSIYAISDRDINNGIVAIFLYQKNTQLTPPILVTIPQAIPGYIFTSATYALSATLANDAKNAGVDWSVTCPAVAGACGSFTPTHTAGGVNTTYTAPAAVPPGGTVVITATSTASPAKQASVNLNIKAPVAVRISTAPPAKLLIGAQSTVAATVLNDDSAKGVDWSVSCGANGAVSGADCGSFSVAHTASGTSNIYTAPSSVPAQAGGAVTLIATSTSDPTRQATSTVTIEPLPISVAFTPLPIPSQAVSLSQSIAATVTNDGADRGVDWTVTCGTPGGCGSFNPSHTASGAATSYTAPAAIPTGATVAVTATSTADSTKSATASITITAKPVLTLVFAATPPAQLETSASLALTVSVANDPKDAGVDWSLTCGGTGTACGTLSAAHTASGASNSYTAPAFAPPSKTVTVTITSTADPSKTLAATITIFPKIESPLVGKVLVAGHPVNGSSVMLYTPGTTDYGSAATALLAAPVTTDASGRFSISSDYVCPLPSSPIYLLATGGDPGTGANPALSLMAALGACDSLSSSTIVNPATLTVNEATTVASVYALSAFVNSGTKVGASSTNALGIANGFGSALNLADFTTGRVLAKTPAGNGTVPQALIGTLANLISACASGGAASSPCVDLFLNATPPGGTAPTDTVTALADISQNPNSNVAALYALAPPAGPFQPVLSAAPNSWLMPITFTGAGMIGSSSLAIDGQGDVWTTNYYQNPNSTNYLAISLSKLSPSGVPISPDSNIVVTQKSDGTLGFNVIAEGGFTAASLGAPASLAIDLGGNAWTVDSGQSHGNYVADITEILSDGTAVNQPTGFQSGGLGAQLLSAQSLAIDGTSQIWATLYSGTGAAIGVLELDNSGVPISPSGGYLGGGLNLPQKLLFDGSGHVWVTNNYDNNQFNLVELSDTDGSPITTSPGVGNFPQPSGFAIDRQGNFWIGSAGTENSGLIKVGPDGKLLSSAGGVTPPGFNNIGGIAIDGANRVWASAYTDVSGEPTVNVILEFASDGTLLSPPSGSVSNTPGDPNLYSPEGPLAIDASGNLWTVNAAGATYFPIPPFTYLGDPLVEFVGAAAPVITPTAAAVQLNKIASRP